MSSGHQPPVGESTSVLLARAERVVDAQAKRLDALTTERDALTTELEAVSRCHQILWGLEHAACTQLRRERDLARAELATARQELEQWRTTAINTSDLRIVLDQQPHHHQVPGRWDYDGSRCQECAARTRLKTALAAMGLAQGSSHG